MASYMRFIISLLLAFLLLGQQFSYADYPIKGKFVANNCVAYAGIKNQSEPVSLKAGEAYSATGLNKQDGDFVAIKVDGINKWVAKSCGKLSLNDLNGDIQPTAIAPTTKPTVAGNSKEDNAQSNLQGNVQSCPIQGCADRYLLALSWQSSFCQTHPNKTECIKQSPTSYDATNFTLHGLWPDKLSYCGVSSDDINRDETGNWSSLPPVQTDAQTQAELSKVMPGLVSNLDRHEWYKHGTCDGRNADTYYDLAIGLVEEFNASQVRDLFASNIGKTVTLTDVKRAFDSSFGDGASGSLNLKCGKEDSLVSEIRLKIKRPLVGQKLADVLVPSGGLSCDRVIVDAVGL